MPNYIEYNNRIDAYSFKDHKKTSCLNWSFFQNQFVAFTTEHIWNESQRPTLPSIVSAI